MKEKPRRDVSVGMGSPTLRDMVITENARHPPVPMATKNSAFLLTGMVQLDEQYTKERGHEARGLAER